MPICICVWCPLHQPSCSCILCPSHRRSCTCVWCQVHPPVFHCPVTQPQGAMTTPLPLHLREVRGTIWPPHWSNGQENSAGAVEEPWSDYVEDSDGVSEPAQSTSNNVDGRGTNLPSIHTLRLPGLRRVSDQQPGPSNALPSLPTTTTHYQVPSQPRHASSVPEQDSPYESLDESSGDSGDMDSEETRSGSSSPLSPDLEEEGSGLTWSMFGPAFARHVPQFR